MAIQLVAATYAGRIVQGLLKRDQPAVVMGVTSRGVFVRLAQDWVVFLSYEQRRGPLTVNIDGRLAALQVGEAAVVEGGTLRFGSGWALTGLDSAPHWEAPAPPALQLAPAGTLVNRLRETAASVLERRGERGMAALLAPLLHLPQPSTVDPQLAGLIQELYCALESGDWQTALHPATRMLGLGSGLTPSGDDLVLGLLLGMNRMVDRKGDQGIETTKSLPSGLLSFGEAVVDAARDRTTSLSAGLLACAAQGQADERLVAALDGLLSGSLNPTACADLFLGWGSSSGCDALVGIALAILVNERC